MTTNLKITLLSCILFLVFPYGNAIIGQACTFDPASAAACANIFNYPTLGTTLNSPNAAHWYVSNPVSYYNFPNWGSSNIKSDTLNPYLVFNPTFNQPIPLPSLLISTPDAVAGSLVNLTFSFYQYVSNTPAFVYTPLQLSCGPNQSIYNISNPASPVKSWQNFSISLPGSVALYGCNITLPGYIQVYNQNNRSLCPLCYVFDTPAIDNVLFTLMSPAPMTTTTTPTTTTAITTPTPLATTANPPTTTTTVPTTTTAPPTTTTAPPTATTAPPTTTTAPPRTTTAPIINPSTTTQTITQIPNCVQGSSLYLTPNQTWICVADGIWQTPVQSGSCSVSCGSGTAEFTYTICYKSSNFSKDCNVSQMTTYSSCFLVSCPVTVCQVMKDKSCADINNMYRNYVPSLLLLGVNVGYLGSIMGFLDTYDIDSVQKQLNGFACDINLMNSLNFTFDGYTSMINSLLTQLNSALNLVYSILDCNPGEINPMQWDRFDEIIEYISIVESISGDVQQRQRMIEQQKINCGGQKTILEKIAAAVRQM